MRIQIPLASSSLEHLSTMLMEPWSCASYAVDASQIAERGGDLSLEVRVTTAGGNYAIFGRAFRKLPRHDLPQLAVVKLGPEDVFAGEKQTKIELPNSPPHSTALLWTEERFAGIEGVYKRGEPIRYVTGFMFSFGTLTLIFAASQSEPDVLILSEPSSVAAYIQTLESVEYFRSETT